MFSILYWLENRNATMTRTGGRQIRGMRRGFTFVEILAAMLFMAIVIPITVEGMMVANRAGVLAERKRVATRLADEQLTDMILNDEWQTGNQSGNFGDDYSDYRWNMTSEPWSYDTESPMTLVSIDVWFKVQAQEYQVRLSTLVDEEDS
jgi:type II secretory pathway pseudopilin PulG